MRTPRPPAPLPRSPWLQALDELERGYANAHVPADTDARIRARLEGAYRPSQAARRALGRPARWALLGAATGLLAWALHATPEAPQPPSAAAPAIVASPPSAPAKPDIAGPSHPRRAPITIGVGARSAIMMTHPPAPRPSTAPAIPTPASHRTAGGDP